jgi:hypothetical protein
MPTLAGKNKCKNGKFYKHKLNLKGGANNCGNTGNLGPAWHCNGTIGAATAFSNKSDTDPCKCGGMYTAVTGTALSNATSKIERVEVYEFSCKWGKRWKGGRSSDYQFIRTPIPVLVSTNSTEENFVSESYLEGGTDFWNYDLNTLTINNLKGHVKK